MGQNIQGVLYGETLRRTLVTHRKLSFNFVKVIMSKNRPAFCT